MPNSALETQRLEREVTFKKLTRRARKMVKSTTISKTLFKKHMKIQRISEANAAISTTTMPEIRANQNCYSFKELLTRQIEGTARANDFSGDFFGQGLESIRQVCHPPVQPLHVQSRSLNQPQMDSGSLTPLDVNLQSQLSPLAISEHQRRTVLNALLCQAAMALVFRAPNSGHH